jgi:beta-N-acetylhexosaminidase
MSLGPLMMDLSSLALSEDEALLLQHPWIGGVILFARNYENPEQLIELTASIREANPDLLIAVDQEGGRVQRLQEGFTPLPPMRKLGELYDKDPQDAGVLAEITGWLMATEVLSVGIDFSFAPVLDLDYGVSEVIGTRAFHSDPMVVTQLAHAFISGMQSAGMQAVGKHFPGHGAIAPDSHLEIVEDDRSFGEIENEDIQPFRRLISADLTGIMPAHIIFPKVDPMPVGFSPYWLKTVLRNDLNFEGVIFSDDLSMQGASIIGSLIERTEKALSAGCDMALICNHREGLLEVLNHFENKPLPLLNERLVKMRGIEKLTREVMLENPNWQHARHKVLKLVNDKTKDETK